MSLCLTCIYVCIWMCIVQTWLVKWFQYFSNILHCKFILGKTDWLLPSLVLFNRYCQAMEQKGLGKTVLSLSLYCIIILCIIMAKSWLLHKVILKKRVVWEGRVRLGLLAELNFFSVGSCSGHCWKKKKKKSCLKNVICWRDTNLRDDIWATAVCLQEHCNQQRFVLETW